MLYEPSTARAVLVGHWWAIGLRGTLGIVFGLLAFSMPLPTIIALVWLFGAYVLLDGVFNLLSVWRGTSEPRPLWALLLSGIAGVGAGVVSFVWPGITALVLIYLIAAWALIKGGLELIAAAQLTGEVEGPLVLALSGVLSMLLGGLLAIFPDLGAIGLVWFFGAYAMVFGVLMISLSYRLRSRGEEVRSERSDLAA